MADYRGPLPSYTGKAVATLLLYWLFWLPGLVANILFYNEAKADERRMGQSLPGVGCLTVLLWINVIWLVLLVILIFGLVAVGTG